MATEPVTTNGPAQTADATVLTLSEAAVFLRVSEEGLKKDADAGLLPGRLVGGEWRFVKHALVEWLSTALPARSGPGGPSDWKHEEVIIKAMPQGGAAQIVDFPTTDETPEEQEAFLEQLRLIRKSYGTVGGEGAEETP
jgi:helix-turn-helix protein